MASVGAGPSGYINIGSNANGAARITDILVLEGARVRKGQLLAKLESVQPEAEVAAQRGVHVTGVTISKEQLEFARARLQRAGLADRVDLQFRDYRDIQGRYDHIVSIEMVEAVGERYWPGY